MQVKGFDNIDIPPMKEQMDAALALANLRRPCKFIGLAINTRNPNQEEAANEIDRAEKAYGLPACDVYRMGAEKLVEACVNLRAEAVTI